ncbi:poly [ADP-ribose] polymerase-like isoform X2 [Leptidea sinapis]|nr:poly [ADP-ribose] polymerase-like isoform X2 [Leptidea sinapis]
MLKYSTGYAKSSKSTCGKCNKNIEKKTLRIAVLRKIKGIKTPKWYHEQCFFNNDFRVGEINEFEYYNTLDNKDQERLKNKLVDPYELNDKTIERNENRRYHKAVLSEFMVEISANYKKTCNECKAKVLKGDLMMRKLVYDEKVGEFYTNYHVKCLSLTDYGVNFAFHLNDLPGFNELSEENQSKLREQLNMNEDMPDSICKKIKLDYDVKDEEKENKTNYHLVLYDKYLRELSNVTKKSFELLCKQNYMRLLKGKDKQLSQIADCLAFGALERCPKCRGQLQLETFYYECTGFQNVWSKCDYRTKTPSRKCMEIPDEILQEEVFRSYVPSIGVRLFCDEPIATAVKLNNNVLKTKVKKEAVSLPLKNVQFYLYRYDAAEQEALRRRILKLGGLVTSRIVDTLAAVVTTKESLEKPSRLVNQIKRLDIHVVDEAYFAAIESSENMKVFDSLALIEKYKIAEWGSDVYSRVPEDVIKERPVRVSGDKYKTGHDKPKIVTVKVKDGVALESGTWLEENAHVYKEGSDHYSVNLNRVDVSYKQMENYSYRLQLVEHDFEKRYAVTMWWGETGTLGRLTVEDCDENLAHAIKLFKRKFFQKTGNQWDRRDQFQKRMGKYDIVNTAKFVDDESVLQLKMNMQSSLPAAIQRLMILLFNINVINMTIADINYDASKLPLGVLSQEQISKGAEVLYELSRYIPKGKVSQSKFKELSNMFYTYIPHKGDIKTLKILDSLKDIAEKIVMLYNLQNIHISYNVLVDKMEEPISRMESCYSRLDTEIYSLDPDSSEYKQIMRYSKTNKSEIHTFDFEVDEIFKVERHGELDRYSTYKSFHNRMLLWHGSRLSNIAGILKKGLQIDPPKVKRTGAMFGKGIYFADVVTKSAQYLNTSPEFPTGILFLCEVALGKM